MHTATKEKKKTKNKVVLTLEMIALVVLCIILAGYIIRAISASEEAPGVLPYLAPEPAPTPATEPSPTAPPDLREYDIKLDKTGNSKVDSAVDEIIASVRSEFDGKFDGLESAKLTLDGRFITAENAVSLIAHVQYPEEDRLDYYVFLPSTGKTLSLEDIYGADIRAYIADYFQTAIAYDEQYADRLSESFEASVTAESEYFDRFVIDEDGSLCISFPGDTVLADEESVTFTVPANVVSGEFFGYRRIYTDKPMVALTFDDGPHEYNTDRILDILKENGAVATFFDIGMNVKKHPDVEKRVAESGNEIGSHTYWHTNLATANYPDSLYDIEVCNKAFEAAIGYVPKLIRPPEGSATGPALLTTNQIFIGWSVDTLDWLEKKPENAFKAVTEFGDLDGQVILMHSIYDASVSAVEMIVPWLISEGYQLVTVSELLEYCYGIVPQSSVYYAYDFFVGGRPVSEEPLPASVIVIPPPTAEPAEEPAE